MNNGFSSATELPQQRLELLEKGVSIPHWYWKKDSRTLIDHYIKKEDILTLKNLGFRHVRIPFEMKDLDIPRVVKQLKKDIQQFVDHKMGVIIAAFGEEYNQGLMAKSLAKEWLQKLCSELKDTNPDFVFIQIANEPLSENNCPTNPALWTSTQEELIQTARQILPPHTLITSTPLKFGPGDNDWNMLKAFEAMKPCQDQNVVYAFHFYEPHLFTHQGADWDHHAKWVKSLSYPSTSENSQAICKSLPEEAPNWMHSVIRDNWNAAKLKESLKPVLNWQKQHQKKIIITEFGVYKSYTDPASRLQWFTDVIPIFKEHNLFWTLWEYDGGFGLFKIQDGFREIDKEMAKALGLNTQDY